MSRYINADALLEEWGIDIEPIKGRPIKMDEFRDFMRRYENHPYYFAILAIALEENADVIEVVNGEWIHNKVSQLWECSACHEEEIRTTPYCPHCGAKMEVSK